MQEEERETEAKPSNLYPARHQRSNEAIEQLTSILLLQPRCHAYVYNVQALISLALLPTKL